MKYLLDKLYVALKVLLTILMGVLIVPVTMQIFARYVGFIPRYIWTEELARFCFIWIILIGAMIAMREGEHFAVDLLPTPRSNRGKAVALLFVDSMVLLLALIFVVWGWPLVQFGLLQTSEMAELPMVLIYMAWPITGIVWMLFLSERFIDHIKLFRSNA
ncbi:MAG: TRAP transporter small permease [Alphaproteobacteria bacterium]